MTRRNGPVGVGSVGAAPSDLGDHSELNTERAGLSSALVRILNTLSKRGAEYKLSGEQFMALCPMHADEKPSLAIRQGDDGQVLLYCHAGCDTGEILTELDLTFADLEGETGGVVSRPCNVARRSPTIYPYQDYDGTLLFQKLRYDDPRTFCYRHRSPDGSWVWNLRGVKRVLYRRPELRNGINNGQPVYVVEGEKDADRAASLSYVATCNPEGANKWLPEYSEALRGADVRVIADYDSVGYDHARDIRRGLTGIAASIKVYRGAVTTKGADLSDHLDAGYSIDDLILVDLDKDIPPDGMAPDTDDSQPVDDAVQFQERVAHELLRLQVRKEADRQLNALTVGPTRAPKPMTLTDLLAEPRNPNPFLLDGLLPVGGRVVVAGLAKNSKTTTMGNLIRSLADGDPFLGQFQVNMPPDARIFMLDTEVGKDMLVSWLEDQGIKHSDRISVESIRGELGVFDIMDPPRLRQWAELLHELNTRVLIVDCLGPLLVFAGLDENHDAGRYLSALDELMNRAGIGELILVHHMGHNGERARGDSRFLAWPDVGWKLTRQDPDDPASDRYFSAFGRGDVNVPKSRLEYDPVTRHLTLGDPVQSKSKSKSKGKDAITDLMRAVLETVHKEPGINVRGILTVLIADGKSDHGVRDAIKRAVSAGLLRVEPVTGGGHCHELTLGGRAALGAKIITNGSGDLSKITHLREIAGQGVCGGVADPP